MVFSCFCKNCWWSNIKLAQQKDISQQRLEQSSTFLALLLGLKKNAFKESKFILKSGKFGSLFIVPLDIAFFPGKSRSHLPRTASLPIRPKRNYRSCSKRWKLGLSWQERLRRVLPSSRSAFLSLAAVGSSDLSSGRGTISG